jgi:ABC-type amino acid transport system permease subunit
MYLLAFTQQMNTKQEEPTDFMRSNGKIYVVVAVIVTIVTGLFIYLFNLDRKIKNLEKSKNQ